MATSTACWRARVPNVVSPFVVYGLDVSAPDCISVECCRSHAFANRTLPNRLKGGLGSSLPACAASVLGYIGTSLWLVRQGGAAAAAAQERPGLALSCIRIKRVGRLLRNPISNWYCTISNGVFLFDRSHVHDARVQFVIRCASRRANGGGQQIKSNQQSMPQLAATCLFACQPILIGSYRLTRVCHWSWRTQVQPHWTGLGHFFRHFWWL